MFVHLLSLSVNHSSSNKRIWVKLLLTNPLSNMSSSFLTGLLYLQGHISSLWAGAAAIKPEDTRVFPLHLYCDSVPQPKSYLSMN